jgi:aspartyl-tRNA(Asn)/glutamyl-tRNA(Gln) amidotransferase subunit A
VIAPIARNVADAALAFEAMAGRDPRDSDSTLVESGDVDLADLRVAFSPKLGLDTPVDPTIAGRLEGLVEHLGKRGQRIVRRDPVWPPGATEETLMPLQHAGLAALYGGDFQKDPG